MRISELIERLGRTVFEAPFGALAQTIGESPEVAEIRIAMLDEVTKKIQRAGGKALFPYNVVRIFIQAEPADAAVFQRDFFRRFFEEEVRKTLAKEACRYPEDLRVDIEASDVAVKNGNWLHIETLSEDAPDPVAVPRTRKSARLIVVEGTANRSEIPLQKPRVNLG